MGLIMRDFDQNTNINDTHSNKSNYDKIAVLGVRTVSKKDVRLPMFNSTLNSV